MIGLYKKKDVYAMNSVHVTQRTENTHILSHRVNNREAGDLRLYRSHYDVIVMWYDHYPSDRSSVHFCRILDHKLIQLLWIRFHVESIGQELFSYIISYFSYVVLCSCIDGLYI